MTPERIAELRTLAVNLKGDATGFLSDALTELLDDLETEIEKREWLEKLFVQIGYRVAWKNDVPCLVSGGENDSGRYPLPGVKAHWNADSQKPVSGDLSDNVTRSLEGDP